MWDIGDVGATEGKMMSLSEIASWPPFSGEVGGLPSVVAGVPSLQRGLVWRSGQVELMWDSLARGFPIGSLVVCPKLGGAQATRGVSSPEEDRVTHHLLDGQQRAQAIRLGFVDPFAEMPNATLWLDLVPGKPGGTRGFRFRVTTRAHPWGYAADDEAKRLPVEKIRDSLVRCGFDPFDSNFEKRPLPSACWPFEAVAPVPVAWLMHAEDDTDDALAAAVANGCTALAGTQPSEEWTRGVIEALADPVRRQDLERVWTGVRRLRRTMIAVLSVPRAVLLESASGGQADSEVAVAEMMFQRLNGGGTALDSDELAYSMIKARWPEVEACVDAVAAKRKLPEARLVTLASRLPMADGEDGAATVSSRVNVDAIRRLAFAATDSTDTHSATRKAFKRDRFEQFFRAGSQFGLEQVMERVGQWCATGDEYDLPIVLQTTLARGAPDVYALLLWMADRALRDGTADAPGVGRRVQGVLTSLAWFASDQPRAAAATAGVLADRGPLREESFERLLAAAHEANQSVLRLPPSPDELEGLLPEPGDDPRTWGLWKRLADDEPIKVSARQIVGNRDMLLYAQRNLLKKKFPNYDPSRKDLWADHDRPWDFDHLLANKSVIYRANLNGIPKEILWDWSKRCIANLRAWPFAHNRSDGAAAPSHKFEDSSLPSGMNAEEAMQLSFLETSELAGFNEGFSFARGSGDEECLRKFVVAARIRLLRIYREWYGLAGLNIAYLSK